MDWQSLTHLWGISAVWFKYRETEPSLVTPLQWTLGSRGTLELLSNLKVRLVCPPFPAFLTGSTCAVSIMPGWIAGEGWWWASAPSALLARSPQSEHRPAEQELRSPD